MPAAILDSAGWDQVHATAVALGSLQAAADAHGIQSAAVRQRARRDGWLIGSPESIAAARAARAISQPRPVVLPRVTLSQAPAAMAIDSVLQHQSRETRAMLSTGLMHAAGQARRTRHPLDRAREIKAVAEAAAVLHGWDAGAKEPHIRLRVIASGSGAGSSVAAEVELG